VLLVVRFCSLLGSIRCQMLWKLIIEYGRYCHRILLFSTSKMGKQGDAILAESLYRRDMLKRSAG
jgi:hypothetical protein